MDAKTCCDLGLTLTPHGPSDNLRMIDPEDGMIRISHAPRYRDVHLATIFRWSRLGKLPTVKLASGRTFISLDDLDALLTPAS